MKHLYLIIFSFLLISCKKDLIEQNNKMLLQKITVNGKINQTFEYNGNLLVKENNFGLCEKNPNDEYFYTYENNQLKKLEIITRSLYSSTDAICNPAMGMHFEEKIEYDNQSRISKIIRKNSYTEYQYNNQGYIGKLTSYVDNNTFISTYNYDAKGNLIEETGYDGSVKQYEYDDKINPFYIIKQQPTWITPFNISPNNVIKCTTASGGFSREIQYNSLGLPSQVKENNVIYMYEYN